MISPLRALVGAGALAPVMGGYCIMQMLALQVLGGGYWMANQLYADMITDTFNAASATPASGAIPVDGMNTLIGTAFRSDNHILRGRTTGQAISLPTRTCRGRAGRLLPQPIPTPGTWANVAQSHSALPRTQIPTQMSPTQEGRLLIRRVTANSRPL